MPLSSFIHQTGLPDIANGSPPVLAALHPSSHHTPSHTLPSHSALRLNSHTQFGVQRPHLPPSITKSPPGRSRPIPSRYLAIHKQNPVGLCSLPPTPYPTVQPRNNSFDNLLFCPLCLLSVFFCVIRGSLTRGRGSLSVLMPVTMWYAQVRLPN